MNVRLSKKDYLFSIFVFIVFFSICSMAYIYNKENTYKSQREHYHYIVANRANIMQGYIDTILARSYTLSAMVFENSGDTDFFNTSASQIYYDLISDTGVNLYNIGIAPKGVISDIYPLEGNEDLIGFSFMDNLDIMNFDNVSSYDDGTLFITNPIKSAQGEYTFQGILPVFLSNSNSEKEFWGLVLVTIDFEQFLKITEIDSLSDIGINYELWINNPDGSKNVLSASKHLPEEAISYDITTNNLLWHLDISPKRGWKNNFSYVLGLVVIFAFSILLSLFILSLIRIKKINNALKIIADRDSLTGCFSRHFVNTALIDTNTGKWISHNMKYSMVIVDIDYFKNINDTYGHDVGDHALFAVANALKGLCRSGGYDDYVIRYGGDEFIVLFNFVTYDRLEQRLKEIMKAIENLRFREQKNLHLTVSIGAQLYDETSASTFSDLFSKADANLYKSKRDGRKRYTLS